MSTRRNLIASGLGNAWTALVHVAFVPVYIALLGVEAYGLIGFYAVLQVALSILDLGLTPTLGREAARFAGGAQGVERLRDLLRSVEWAFLAIAVLLVGAVFSLAPWIARHWLQVQELPLADVARALELMGLMVGLRWLAGLHRSVVVGLQQLVWLNYTVALFATVRAAGVVLVLVWVSPTIEAFFTYQCAVTALEAAVLARKAWRLVPFSVPARFSGASLRAIGGFSSGMAAMTTLYLVLTIADKALLSTLLPLPSFAVYALAASVAGALSLLVAPIGQVAFPALNLLAARGDSVSLAGSFHSLAQLMTVAVAPAAWVLALFAEPILALWTRDAELSAAAAPLLALLSIGAMLNAFMGVPYMVPLAHGRTRGLVVLNACLVAVFVPAIYAGVMANGAVAAAVAWVAVNAIGVGAAWPLLHADLPEQRLRWLMFDVGAPALAALLAAGAVRSLAPADGGALGALLGILGAYVCALAAAMAVAPACRRWISGRPAARATAEGGLTER